MLAKVDDGIRQMGRVKWAMFDRLAEEMCFQQVLELCDKVGVEECDLQLGGFVACRQGDCSKEQ